VWSQLGLVLKALLSCWEGRRAKTHVRDGESLRSSSSVGLGSVRKSGSLRAVRSDRKKPCYSTGQQLLSHRRQMQQMRTSFSNSQ
jgi:hypothetical protein